MDTSLEVRPAQDKTPTCIAELKWYHPLVDCCEKAEGILLNSCGVGEYLLRPSSIPNTYTLSVRAKTSVKHFKINATSSEITFGLAKFGKFDDFLEHFKSKPLLGDSSGELVVLTTPVLFTTVVPASKHQTVLEPTSVHGEMSPTSPNGKLSDLSVKTGFLIKQGGLVKNWKERWIVADSKDLKYYQREEDFTPKGIIDLRDCTCCRKTNTPLEAFGKENTFVLMTPWRTFLFSAATATDMESWVAYLKGKLENIKKARG